ncbi:MAG: hypothetical protein KA257_13180 [Opitutaceae bacterium]|nr:hypothetical protein [Opitutaceae bacterium]MBP9913384.1 hypothetical protein [Opitutaceae bacterium]
MQPTLANRSLGFTLGRGGTPEHPTHYVRSIAFRDGSEWREILAGVPGGEFATSLASVDASHCEIHRSEAAGGTVHLHAACDAWTATAVLTLAADEPLLTRRQTYRFLRPCVAAIHPGFLLRADERVRYTYPLRAHEQPLAALRPLRAPVDWALPFPFHVWHDGRFVALYGVDRTTSAGTLDFSPQPEGQSLLRIYYPDTSPVVGLMPSEPPGTRAFAAGEEFTLTEVLAVRSLAAGQEPLLEAERIAATLLLRTPPPGFDAEQVAAGIAAFFPRCELWEPNALGPGRGWFSNMWVRTQTGPAKKRGEMSGYFDLGWGEGIAVEIWMGAVRHWQRTRDRGLLPYVDEMTRNLDFFRRDPGPAAPYYDRTDGQRCGDFLMDFVPGDRIWTHSLGHTGSQLLQLFQLAPDYPNVATRQQWLAAATSIATFLAQQQRSDGDLPDIFDRENHEVNRKRHRIAARAVVCGLWARLAGVTGDDRWLEHAQRLAAAVAPELRRYEYYNQMLDGIVDPAKEFVDGEAACYVLEGLVPLYAATRSSAVLALCQKAAAFAIAWTYFYDLPHANRGIARGGQCCRMDDFPLLYPIGSAKAMEPLLALAHLTGDGFYRQIADEMAAFIGHWQVDAPGQPWDGGMIHALGQFSGQHWGPDLAGQIDTGMATGNSLAALECWLADRATAATRHPLSL